MTEQTIGWKEKVKTKVIDNVVQGIDLVDSNSKLVNEVTTIVKGVISKDPRALDDNIASYFIKNNLGESMYDKIRKVYHDIIGSQ